MSEFSESYHLKTGQASEAVELLRRAGVSGFVFPPENGWVTFLAVDGKFVPDQRITNANQQALLHFHSCDDHGWGFSYFEAGKPVCSFKCDWTRKVKVTDSQYSGAVLEQLIAAHGTSTLVAVEAVLRPSSFERAMELRPAEVFVSAVGLSRSAWLPFDQLADDYESSPRHYPDVVKVE